MAANNIKTLRPSPVAAEVAAPRPKLSDMIAAARAEGRAEVESLVEAIEALRVKCVNLADQEEVVPAGIIETARRLGMTLAADRLRIQSISQKVL